MQMPEEIAVRAAEIIGKLTESGLTVATAESCTGGLLAGALTSIPGSSEVVYGGFVTYANEAKIAMLGVPFGLLRQHGAVSKDVAIAMAEGAQAAAGTHLAVAVTGVAGPGQSEKRPAGLVHIAVASEAGTRHLRKQFGGLDRDGVRQASVLAALELLLKVAGQR